jgi:hypothetical protein
MRTPESVEENYADIKTSNTGRRYVNTSMSERLKSQRVRGEIVRQANIAESGTPLQTDNDSDPRPHRD